MKKIVAWLLVVCLLGCFALTSCGKKDPDPAETEKTTVTEEKNSSQTGEHSSDLSTEESSEPEPEDPTPDDNLYGTKNWTKNY